MNFWTMGVGLKSSADVQLDTAPGHHDADGRVQLLPELPALRRGGQGPLRPLPPRHERRPHEPRPRPRRLGHRAAAEELWQVPIKVKRI